MKCAFGSCWCGIVVVYCHIVCRVHGCIDKSDVSEGGDPPILWRVEFKSLVRTSRVADFFRFIRNLDL